MFINRGALRFPYLFEIIGKGPICVKDITIYLSWRRWRIINQGIIDVLVGFVGLSLGYLIRKYIAEARIQSAEEAARKIIDDAEKEANARSREVLLEAKEESHKLRNELEKECRERRAEIQGIEKRLLQREELLDRKNEFLDKKEISLSEKEEEVEKLRESVSR